VIAGEPCPEEIVMDLEVFWTEDEKQQMLVRMVAPVLTSLVF
jgi:hypothetical protein